MDWKCHQVERMKTVAGTVGRLEQAGSETCLLAGGTDLFVKLRKAPPQSSPTTLLDISGIEEMRGISQTDGWMRLGAASTIAEIAQSALIRRSTPALAEAAASMASPQVRVRATIGGNLVNASPAADTTPVLVALGGEAEIAGPAGRRRVPVSALALGPGRTSVGGGELLVRLWIPLAGAHQAFAKMGRRRSIAIAVVNAASCLEVEDGVVRSARLALGAVAPTVLTAGAASLLEGREVAEGVPSSFAEAVREEVRPISDLRAGADYRRLMAGLLAQRVAEAAFVAASRP